MAENDEVTDKVGLGVDLIGGQQTLEMLRAIRTEMVAIKTLAGGGPGGPGGPGATLGGDISARNKVYNDSARKLAEDRIRLERQTSQQEVDIRAAALNQKLELNRRINARAEDLRQQEKQRQIQAEREESERQRRYLESRRARIKQYAESEDILSRNFNSERRSFKRYRTDEARDPQTDDFRRQLAERVQGQRNAQRQQLQIEREAEAQKKQSFRDDIDAINYRDSRLRAITERQRLANVRQPLYDSALIRRGDGSIGEAEPINDALSRLAKRNLRNDPQGNPFGFFYQAPHLNASKRGATALGLNDLTDVSQLNASQYRQLLNAGRIDPKTGSILPPKGPPTPPSGPSGGGGGGRSPKPPADTSLLGNLGDTVGRITKNFLIYRALTFVATGLIRVTEESLAAAKATTEQANALKYATEASHGSLEANRALAVGLQQYGYNQAQALQVVSAAARATYRNPALTAPLAREATDIAALRGGGLGETTRVLEDVIGGRDRPYREYFNTTPEEIYKEAAKKRLAQNTGTLGLKTIGAQDYTTDEQKISKYVSALTEQEKEQLRLNFVLSQAYRFQGDAADRATTLAGKMDLVSASFFNATANVGAFIADIGPLKNILDSIANAPQGSILAPPQLRQGGPQNTITDANIVEYGAQNSTSSRASALHFISKISGSVVNNLSALNSVVNLVRDVKGLGNSAVNGPGISDQEYDRIISENIAKSQQQRQLSVLRKDNKLGYRALSANSGTGSQYFSYGELVKQGHGAGDILKNYIEDIKPVLDDGAKALDEYRQKRFELIAEINGDGGDNARNKLSKLDSQRDATLLVGFKPADYDTDAQKREDDRRAKELEGRNKRVAELGNALGKLRDAQQGSFRLPGDIGTSLAGEDNSYVKVLSDEATAAERMRQQWGFLGQAAVDYFTILEQGAAKRQLNKLEFQTYTTASNLRGQADREAAERNGPGFSRREQDFLDVQSAIVAQAREIPNLFRQAADITGVNPTRPGISLTPQRQLQGSLALISRAFGVTGPRQRNLYNQDITPDLIRRNVYGQSLGGIFDIGGNRTNVYGQSLADPRAAQAFGQLGAGQSPEVQNALRKSFAETILNAFQGYTPSQIRQSGLQDFYLGAVKTQAGSLGFDIDQAKKKAQFGADADARLNAQLAVDETFRQSQLRKGYDAKDVGRESDALLLSRTDNVASKDLTFTQFATRQEALRRQADRAEQDRQEAKAAINKGLEYQSQMVDLLASIRAGLLSGDVSMLVQVQNDTQARIDQNSLQDLSSGNFSNGLDQSESKTSPYTSSFARYKRGGRK